MFSWQIQSASVERRHCQRRPVRLEHHRSILIRAEDLRSRRRQVLQLLGRLTERELLHQRQKGHGCEQHGLLSVDRCEPGAVPELGLRVVRIDEPERGELPTPLVVKLDPGLGIVLGEEGPLA